jgi:hypothetical protein
MWHSLHCIQEWHGLILVGWTWCSIRYTAFRSDMGSLLMDAQDVAFATLHSGVTWAQSWWGQDVAFATLHSGGTWAHSWWGQDVAFAALHSGVTWVQFWWMGTGCNIRYAVFRSDMGSFLIDGQDVAFATLPGFCCETGAVSFWDNEGWQLLLAMAQTVGRLNAHTTRSCPKRCERSRHGIKD